MIETLVLKPGLPNDSTLDPVKNSRIQVKRGWFFTQIKLTSQLVDFFFKKKINQNNIFFIF